MHLATDNILIFVYFFPHIWTYLEIKRWALFNYEEQVQIYFIIIYVQYIVLIN